MPASAPDKVPMAMVTVLAWPSFLSLKVPLAPEKETLSPAIAPSRLPPERVAAVVAS